MLLGIWLIAEVRVYVLLIILGCIVAYIIAKRAKRYTVSVFALLMLVAFGAAMLTQYLHDDYNVVYTIWYRQANFMYLNHGNTNLALPEIEQSTWGIIKILPVAFENVFMHPNMFELLNKFMSADFTLNILNGLLFTISCIAFFKSPINNSQKAATLLLILSGFVCALFYGMIVSSVGALSRYRSVPMLLMWLSYSIAISIWLGNKNGTERINKWIFT